MAKARPHAKRHSSAAQPAKATGAQRAAAVVHRLPPEPAASGSASAAGGLDPSAPRVRAITVLGVCVALGMGCFVTTGLWLAGRQSAAYDEVADVGSGYALLRGQWRLDPEHLPLSKLLAALALPDALDGHALPANDASPTTRWVFGNELLHRSEVPPLVSLRAARAPMIWLNALLIPLIACFTYRVGGLLSAVVAVMLASLEPLWLAHATVVGSDALAGLWLYATAALAFWYVRDEGRGSHWIAVALGCSAALCVATKYYGPPALACVWLAAGIDAQRLGKLRALAPSLVTCGAAAAVVGMSVAWGWPPNPSRYLYGLSQLGVTHVQNYDYYAFGWFFHDSPLYLSGALSVKVSIAVLALASVWLARALVPAVRRVEAPSALLWLPALGHLLVMSWLAPPMGARYGVPLLPFAFTLAGLAAGWLWRLPRARWLVPALMCVQLGSFGVAVRSSPLSFFNGLGCYTGQIPPCLDDSNVDWGHALPALDALVNERFGGAPVRASYYGSSPFQAYLPAAQEMTRPEWTAPYRALYAISLHRLARASASSWARQSEPAAIAAGAYALFDLRGREDLPVPTARARK